MRHPRRLQEGATYHVTARVNRREMLLDHSEVRDLFILFLAKARKKFRFEVYNFVVMGNHFHLMVKPAPGESLSDIMRWVLGGFARAYNKKRGLTGHVWGDRFHSRILDGLRQIAIAFGYIDNNPVKAGLVAWACEWRHGGAWHARMGDASILGPGPPWLGILAALRGLPASLR